MIDIISAVFTNIFSNNFACNFVIAYCIRKLSIRSVLGQKGTWIIKLPFLPTVNKAVLLGSILLSEPRGLT